MMMSWTSEEINKLSSWRGINKRQCHAELIQVLLHLIQFNSDEKTNSITYTYISFNLIEVEVHGDKCFVILKIKKKK